MQKKGLTKKHDRNSIFGQLVSDEKKKENLRKVLKKFGKSLDDYSFLWGKDKYL